MVRFLNHGILYNRGEQSGEAFKLGQRVKINSDGKIVGCSEGEVGIGFAYQEARLLSVGDNAQIWDQSIDEGATPGTHYEARRPWNKWTIRNVGDNIAISVSPGSILDDYDLYYGSVVAGDMLGCGVSGLLKKVTDEDLAVATVMRGGTATNGDKIQIMQRK